MQAPVPHIRSSAPRPPLAVLLSMLLLLLLLLCLDHKMFCLSKGLRLPRICMRLVTYPAGN